MDNLNIDWSSGWILSCFFGCVGKIHKPKPWIYQTCKGVHTATLGIKLTSVVCKLEIKINLSKSKVKLHRYSQSISTTKFVISNLFKINIHQGMWNRAPLQIDMHHQVNCMHLFQVYPEILPVFSYANSSQHSKWMDNLNIDWSSGYILSCFFGCIGKIHKPKPWINQVCKEIHTATIGMKLTSVVCKLEIKINLSKSKWNFTPTPNPYAPPNV